MITQDQSYSWVIHDVFYNALKRDTYFANHTFRKNKMLQVQLEHLPYMGVYIVDETMTPDGDPNAGYIGFQHTLRIGFSAVVLNNEPVEAERALDATFWRIMNTLWTDQYVMNLLDTWNPHLGEGNPDNVRVESITRGTRRHVFGAQQLNNEQPLAELQYEVSCFYRTSWEPVITDTFDEMHVRTGIKIGESEEEMAQRQQVAVRYLGLNSQTRRKGHG